MKCTIYLYTHTHLFDRFNNKPGSDTAVIMLTSLSISTFLSSQWTNEVHPSFLTGVKNPS